MLHAKRAESTDLEGAEGPALEMFEEKQLLATCIALREDISRQKSRIITLENRINSLLQQNEVLSKVEGDESENLKGVDEDAELWKQECFKEEKRKMELVQEIIEQKEACCLLRAKLEMNFVKQPKLLVTRF